MWGVIFKGSQVKFYFPSFNFSFEEPEKQNSWAVWHTKVLFEWLIFTLHRFPRWRRIWGRIQRNNHTRSISIFWRTIHTDQRNNTIRYQCSLALQSSRLAWENGKHWRSINFMISVIANTRIKILVKLFREFENL